MRQKNPRKLTSEEIYAIKNSPSFIKKREEAEEMYNSPAYRYHRKQRDAQRSTALKRKTKKS